MRNYAIVGFIYNHPCPVSCDFCCHSVEVVGKGRLTPETVTPLVVKFAKIPSVVRFAFSGGDPFLYRHEITAIMREARGQGVKQPFHMVSSGYWATTDEVVSETLDALQAVGLDAICLSYDQGHGETVPPTNLERIVRHCQTRKITTDIWGIFWEQGKTVEQLLPSLVGHVKMTSNLAMPIGAAINHYFEGPRYDIPDSKKYSCGRARVYEVAIYPDGETFPCCSGGFNKEAKLGCGNVFQDDAQTIIDNVFHHFHARTAKEIGFDKLYAKVNELRPALTSKLVPFANVDSVCELCRHIHSNADLVSQLTDVYEALEIDYVLAKVEKDWHLVTTADT